MEIALRPSSFKISDPQGPQNIKVISFLEPLYDSTGNPVIGSDGQPLIHAMATVVLAEEGWRQLAAGLTSGIITAPGPLANPSGRR